MDLDNMITIRGRIPKKAKIIEKSRKIILMVLIPTPHAPLDISYIDVSQHGKEQVKASLTQWAEGELIQVAFPYLTADERERMLVPSFARL
tara:strand:- start:203 stop:475 length:273 start_codon:yes stop_codon:yes gene_type:complete